MATLLDGKIIAADLLQNARERISALQARGLSVGLAVILVGSAPASQIYVRNKGLLCEELGILSQTIRLPEDHLWAGGGTNCKAGPFFIANMPTEEIFTAPLRDGIDGVVYAALPLAQTDKIVMYGDGNSTRLVRDVMNSTNQVVDGLKQATGIDLSDLIGKIAKG